MRRKRKAPGATTALRVARDVVSGTPVDDAYPAERETSVQGGSYTVKPSAEPVSGTRFPRGWRGFR